jgi:hypothetical protein
VLRRSSLTSESKAVKDPELGQEGGSRELKEGAAQPTGRASSRSAFWKTLTTLNANSVSPREAK